MTLFDDTLLDLEKNIDLLRWDYLNELTVFTYFQIETILAFYIKLGIVERWQGLDPAVGEQHYTKLVEELKSGFYVDASIA